MPSLDVEAIWKSVTKAFGLMTEAWNYVQKYYPLRRAIGLFILGTIAVATAAVIWLKQDSAVAHMLGSLFLGFGILLLADREKYYSQIEEKSKAVFSVLLLLERNEEDRRAVAKVAGIVEFLKMDDPRRFDFANFFQHLEELMNAGDRLVEIRGKLENALQRKPDEFQPAYLRAYVQALAGMTYLIEEQTYDSGHIALKSINEAQTALEQQHADAQVSVILNARAICRALLSEKSGGSPLAQSQRLLGALVDFAEAARKVNFTEAERIGNRGSLAMYRFWVNYAECCVRCYHLWEKTSDDERPDLEQRILECFRKIQVSHDSLFVSLSEASGRRDAVPILFDSSGRALAEATKLMQKPDMGQHRPVAYFAAFYWAVAVHRHSQRVSPLDLSNSMEDLFLSEDAAYRNFDEMFNAWKGCFTADKIRKKISSLPGLDDWLEDWKEMWTRCSPRLSDFQAAVPLGEAAPA